MANDASLYIIELTVGFESNIQFNSYRKKAKYQPLTLDLPLTFSNIMFMNLSLSTFGLQGKSCDSLLLFLQDLKFNMPSSKYTIKKIMTIAIRCSYYTFYRRNKS